MRNILSILIMFTILGIAIPVYGDLNKGEIMFVGANLDGGDGFAFLTLVDIPANTTIYFSDEAWDGTNFNDSGSGENTIEWNSGGSAIGAGNVVVFDETKETGTITVTEGTINYGVMKLNNGGDFLYAYQGSDEDTPTTFLSAFGEGGGNLSNTGLTFGTDAINFSNGDDVFAYTGSTTCNTTAAECAAAIANTSNWSSEGGSGDQSGDGGIDFPSSVPSSFNGSALPVELISFDWEYIDDIVKLTWVTASEVNNYGFHIEKSSTGIEFVEIAFIDGNGTTTNLNTYSFQDVSSIGNAYYRLVQEDFDGEMDVIGLIYQQHEFGANDISIYPNPTNGSININGAITGYQLVDSNGRVMLQSDHSTSKVASDQLSEFLVKLNPDIYFLQLQSNEEKSTLRIFKH